MAEKEEGKKTGGWFKTILGTLGGLFSGALVMYCSAFIDRAVKPPRPVPNFRAELQGHTVHFQNLSPGFTGWWDFGDGTELVPADGNHQAIDHTYDRGGDYSVKLSLSNLLGEDADRTVALHVEDPPEVKQPQVLSLDARRVNPGAVPAVFQVTAKTAGAVQCVWDVSDERPLDIVTDDTAAQDRMVQFDKPGNYVIELVATNGNRWDRKTASVNVAAAPAGGVGVVLAWTDAGVRLVTRTVPVTFSDTFRPDVKGERCPLSGRDIRAAWSSDPDKDWVIRDVQVTGASGKTVSLGSQTDLPLDAAALGLKNAQNLRLQLAKDRGAVHLIGDLMRPAGATTGPPPSVVLQGVLTEELRKPVSRPMQVPTMLLLPGPGLTSSEVVTAPPPPADWVDVQPRKMTLTVRDGSTAPPQTVSVPGTTDLIIQKRHCTLVSKLVKDKITLDLIAAGRP